MPNSKKMLAVAAVLVLGAAVICAGLALAQSGSDGCPGGANCIDGSDFTAGTDGWGPNGVGITVTQVPELGVLWSTGYGILKVSGTTANTDQKSIVKRLYLGVGHYILKLRATQDVALGGQVNFWVGFSGVSTGYGGCWGQLSSLGYTYLTSCQIDVSTPGPVTLDLTTGSVTYYDYIYLERVSDTAATSTPNVNFPTLTPRPGTPIPTEELATPQPTSAPFCVAHPTPTPAIKQFQSNPPTPTATPATPSWEVLDTFSASNVYGVWLTSGNDTYISDAADHTGNGSRSLFVAYDGIPQATSSISDLTEALVLPGDVSAFPGYPALPGYFYVNGWAQLDNSPTGATGFVELWTRDSSTWTRVNQFPISAQRWYPFHAQVSGGISALAFVVTRSDDPAQGSGGAYLDDLYIYSDLGLTPFCDGKYPDGISDLSGYVVADWGDATLSIPANKLCPGPIDRPNNFWGYLLSGITFFTDQVFAQTPYHEPGKLQGLMQHIVFSPLLGMFFFLSILFDWNIPLWVLSLMVALWIVYSLLLAWKFVRRATVE